MSFLQAYNTNLQILIQAQCILYEGTGCHAGNKFSYPGK